ncbi:DNA-binding transcriptional regulator, FadR family [Parafrankia irregularis]|uniref:DNA-binding transcriptional regulator, FadR family n=1 Tax=Parafrankia irregularis TaxID=795642 RepID=A0A0S4QMJ5_9ACTN|nr:MULTISPECIES: FCD domain-containing protein [Parafrankia]MBE3200458.1 FadR family transcriptional regulator [Parafrankia sp. CH37]CUU56784.1 DNA-binding transcriptional regulator, FadR family [Parafrankia irregularis]
MALGALRSTSLVDQATQLLRDQITSGEWPVGTRLPGENALAATLGVGRSTVREALRALAGAGLLQARQGSGVYVIATEPAQDWRDALRRAAVGDVYEVRMFLEVQAVRLAAQRRTEVEITAMRDALDRRRAAAGGDDETFVDADIALHAAVVAAAHNPVLDGLFTEFLPVLRRGLIDLVDLLGLRATDHNHGDAAHAALVEAVATGDGERASEILQAELDQTLALLRAPTA